MEKKKAIIAQFSKEFNGIFIDPSYIKNKIGNIEKINYPNFKYIGTNDIKDDETGEIKYGVHCIEIINLPVSLIKEISNTINEMINDSNKTITNCIDEILDYFKKITLNKDFKKEILGDLGEAIFILKNLEKGYNFLPYLRNNDNELYDINVGDKNIEIKSSSIEKNDFIMTDEQLKQDETRLLVIVKFKAIKAKTTILDIYKLISGYGTLPNLLLEKQKKWETINELIKQDINGRNDIVKDFSVALNKCQLSLFKNEMLPTINIIDRKSLKKAEYTISCTDNELELIDNLYNKINFNL